MDSLPTILSRGEPARLFPVLADTSKEGRTLSIVLACLQNVEEFGRAMLASLGVRVGVRTKTEAFTEVVLNDHPTERSFRPDGLVVIRSGGSQWSALIEAKIGATDLTTEQVASYVELARLNGVDAVVTLSNQFAPLPSHHPVQLPASSLRKVDLFHWSWMYVLTEATLLLSNDEVTDHDQRIILNEMVRFLTHPSAGVRGFDQMPATWSALVGVILAGGGVAASSAEAQEVVGAWHQLVRDLSLTLSRQLATNVQVQITRAQAADPMARQKSDLDMLAKTSCLRTTLVVPDAASPIEVCADIQKRSAIVSMGLRAPMDRKSTKARVTWLLRQLQQSEASGVHVRLFWPGRAMATQHPLTTLRENPEVASDGRESMAATSFEVLLVKDLGARFGQRRNFVSELETAVPEFYERVGQHLKAWQPAAPPLKEERAEPGTVAPEALREKAEALAADGRHAQGIPAPPSSNEAGIAPPPSDTAPESPDRAN